MPDVVIIANTKDDAEIYIDDVKVEKVKDITIEMVAGEYPKVTIGLYATDGLDLTLLESKVTMNELQLPKPERKEVSAEGREGTMAPVSASLKRK